MTNDDRPAASAGGPRTASAAGRLDDDLPDKLRVHALAKLLGLASKDVLAALTEIGRPATSAQSSIDRDTALRVAAVLLPDPTEPGGDSAEDIEEGALAAPLAPVFVPPQPLFLAPEPPERPARAERPERGERSERGERPERGERSGRGEREDGAERPERPRRQAPVTITDEDDVDDIDDDEDTAEALDDDAASGRRRRRRGRRGRGRGRAGQNGDEDDDADEADDASAAGADEGDVDVESEDDGDAEGEDADAEDAGTRRRRRRRRRKAVEDGDVVREDDPPNTVVHVRESRAARAAADGDDGVQGVKGSTRLEAKRQRRRDGREAGRRRPPILSEAEFLARRESVDRVMVVREHGRSGNGGHAGQGLVQIGVLEDGVLVEHFVTAAGTGSLVGNVYLGRVQNVLPSMEAAFVDIGRGRNAVLYAGEVDWDAAGLEGKARKIEQALSTGDSVLVQVTKDPVGHKGARLTTQISLPGRFLVYVPGGGATGISRKLADTERKRLKDILRRIVPDDAGVIIRTASEGITEEAIGRDVRRLQAQWEVIKTKSEAPKAQAPQLLYEEPDLLIKVVRDLFTEDFSALVVQGRDAMDTIEAYVEHVAPDLATRLRKHVGNTDVFTEYRIDEQLIKALDRKVWLPSGGYLVIDRTEAMTVIDVNTGKFTGAGGNLEETVTRNNLEAAEEIVRQLRLRDIGGIIVIDFIDMVLESNRDLVLRRLTECLGRDRTRHQVAEVTSLGLVQMTRKRVGSGLLEAFSTPCEDCRGRGLLVSTEPVEPRGVPGGDGRGDGAVGRRPRTRAKTTPDRTDAEPAQPAAVDSARPPGPAAEPVRSKAAERRASARSEAAERRAPTESQTPAEPQTPAAAEAPVEPSGAEAPPEVAATGPANAAGKRPAGERAAGERVTGERVTGERAAEEHAAGERAAGERATGDAGGEPTTARRSRQFRRASKAAGSGEPTADGKHSRNGRTEPRPAEPAVPEQPAATEPAATGTAAATGAAATGTAAAAGTAGAEIAAAGTAAAGTTAAEPAAAGTAAAGTAAGGRSRRRRAASRPAGPPAPGDVTQAG